MSFHAPSEYMITHPTLGRGEGNNGCFIIDRDGVSLTVISSDGEGWEHVSVSTPKKTPTWKQMCMIKDLFWDEEDVVIQFHPKKSEYVNNHSHCLHMWRPIGIDLPTPPSIFIGVKSKGTIWP